MAAGRYIIGLGNPGAEYDGTRHNIGFRVVDSIAERLGITYANKAQSLIAEGRWRGRSLGLAKPQTYMNRSGLAVEEIMRRHKLDPQDIMVIVDDIHLPLGKMRIRQKGGSGGHNGLEDIGDWLDSDEWPRLRFGVGSDFERGRQADYVLQPFASEELADVKRLVEHARDAALSFVHDGIVTCMNRFNL